MAIQHYYVFLIIARLMGWNIPEEKTVEVRKDFPKDGAWDNTVHIYCGKNRQSFNRIPKQYQPLMKQLLGKVVGVFVCDSIEKHTVFHKGITRIMIQGYKEKLFALCKAAALSLDELHEYIDKDGIHFEIVYGWHISDLKIYDKPKELTAFSKVCSSAPDAKCYPENCERCPWNAITRPPQNWFYVVKSKCA